jgi:Zn-dependent peptidase ImmA (M78 family)/DNA-binding XRE family transcriptional regulator
MGRYLMSKSFEVKVQPSVLQWLRASSGWSPVEVSKKIGVQETAYQSMELGEKKPTLKQIELLAKAFRRPVAAFLLPSPPQESSLPKDFRLISNEKKEFSKKLRRVFRRARWLQELSSDLMGNLSLNIEANIAKSSLSGNPVELASNERLESNITLETQMRWKTPYEAFAAWRDYLEKKNIRTFQMSMPIDEARGFALTDKKPYLIVVNTADDINARIFTLFHEYGHILLSETSVCIPEFDLSKDSTKLKLVESWCNRFAAEFILPQEIKQRLANDENRGDLGKLLNKYSSRFKVSKYALLVRMREFGLVKDAELAEFVEKVRVANAKKGGFGRGLTQLQRCKQERGETYVSMVLENLDRGFINTRDALDYLSIRMKYLDSLRSRQRGGKNV